MHIQVLEYSTDTCIFNGITIVGVMVIVLSKQPSCIEKFFGLDIEISYIFMCSFTSQYKHYWFDSQEESQILIFISPL